MKLTEFELLDLDDVEVLDIGDHLSSISAHGTLNYTADQHRSCVCSGGCNTGGSSGGGNTMGDQCSSDCHTGGSHCSIAPSTLVE